MYTRQDLLRCLEAMDINPRGVLLVHSSMKAIGEVEAMKRRFPGAKVQRATLRRATLPVKAVAYDSAEGMKLLLFQPDGELCVLLQAVLKDKK